MYGKGENTTYVDEGGNTEDTKYNVGLPLNVTERGRDELWKGRELVVSRVNRAVLNTYEGQREVEDPVAGLYEKKGVRQSSSQKNRKTSARTVARPVPAARAGKGMISEM